MLRNKLVLGDWTGDAAKIADSGWHVKPLGQIFDHPFFSLAGQHTFWSRLCTSFYVGDMSWHGHGAMSSFPSEIFFYLSFAVFPIGLGALWIGRRRHEMIRSRLAGMLGALVIAASVFFLMALSLRFDFGESLHPSRQYPYVNSGRLISGALVPVLALFVCGVAAITGRSRLAIAIITGMSVVMLLLPQVMLFEQVLPSQYNWFHLLSDEAVQFDPTRPDAVQSRNRVAFTAYIHRGAAYAANHELDKAIADFTEAILLDPENPVVYNDRGSACARQGNLGQAISDCTEAIRLNPKYIDAYNNRGVAYASSGELDKAIADYSEVIGLDPKCALAYDNRGLAYQKKGQLDKANRDFAKAKELEHKP